MKGFLTSKEAAARLGITDARIRQMIRSGVIRTEGKFGRENVIPESEITRLQAMERSPGRPRKRAK